MSREGVILVASWLLALAIFSPGLATSTRIAGMGGVSIAVDDLESDPFVNPAKAVRISKPLVLGDFSHQGYSYRHTYEWSNVFRSGNYAWHHSGNSQDRSSPYTSIYRGTCLYPFGAGIVLGGRYHFSYSRHLTEYKGYGTEWTTLGDSITSTSWNNGHNSWKDKAPENEISLLGEVRITPQIALGFSTELILESTEKRTYKDESSYWSSGMSDTSHYLREWAYKTTYAQKEFTGGILVNLNQNLEMGGTFSYSKYNEDHWQTKNVWDTTVVDPDSLSKHRNLAKEDFYSLSLAPKYRFNDLVRIGSVISYSWSRRTNSDRDFGVKTDTGKEKFSSFNIGFGLSLTPDAKTLIALDLILAPEKSTWDYFYTETETTYTGEIHRKGDVRRTEESDYLNKTVRIGMERALSENFYLRIGSNFVITKYDLKTEDKENESRERSSPWADRETSTLTAGFGYLWRGRLKVEYALQARPSSFMGYGPLEFHHQLSLTCHL